MNPDICPHLDECEEDCFFCPFVQDEIDEFLAQAANAAAERVHDKIMDEDDDPNDMAAYLDQEQSYRELAIGW